LHDFRGFALAVLRNNPDIRHAAVHRVTTCASSVSISRNPSPSDPVIYLSQDGPSDYRIFVQSRTFSARDAAALIVGARGGHRRLEAASL
jgi:hypothetical protein